MNRIFCHKVVVTMSVLGTLMACDRIDFFQDQKVTAGGLEYRIEAFNFRDSLFTQIGVYNPSSGKQSIDSSLSTPKDNMICFEGKIEVQKLPRIDRSAISRTIHLPPGETLFFHCKGSSLVGNDPVLKGPFGTLPLSLKTSRP